MSYFPDKYPVGKGPPRAYFFNVLATKYPEYLHRVLTHANKERMTAEGAAMQTETIAMTPYWQEKLESMPYLTRKCLAQRGHLLTLLFLQARTARRSTCSRPAASRSPRPGSAERSSSSVPTPSTRSRRRSRSRRTTRSGASSRTARPRGQRPSCSSWRQGRKPRGRPRTPRTPRCKGNE